MRQAAVGACLIDNGVCIGQVCAGLGGVGYCLAKIRPRLGQSGF